MSEGKRRSHTAPGEGESVWVVGDLITLKLTSEDTGGAFSLFEGTIPPMPSTFTVFFSQSSRLMWCQTSRICADLPLAYAVER